MITVSLKQQLRQLRLLVLDVDGVLTDGGIYLGEDGQTLRRFQVHDGLGIKNLREKGIEIAVITSHNSEAVTRHARSLGIGEIYQGVHDKKAILADIMRRRGLTARNVAYVGDDLVDLPALEQVGIPIAVANAVPEVKRVACYVTDKSGGEGAVREVCDFFLRAVEDGFRTMGVIPARYSSTRFPGKPLADIVGTPMVYHVYSRVKTSCLDEVVVATDDGRILKACEELGCNVVLTSKEHKSGTDRVAEVARNTDADVFVNIQGDEPLIPSELIDDLVAALVSNPQVDMATARKRIEHEQELDNPNVVKVVVDCCSHAIYFSRTAIPYYRDRGDSGEQICRLQYYKHIGIYGYRRSALLRLAELAPTPLELAESLEQLRALEHGMRIKVIDTVYESIGVDTPSDLERVRLLLADTERM